MDIQARQAARKAARKAEVARVLSIRRARRRFRRCWVASSRREAAKLNAYRLSLGLAPYGEGVGHG